MKLTILVVGKTKQQFLQTGEGIYLKKLSPFCQVEFKIIKPLSDIKNQTKEKIINKEGEAILQKIPTDAHVVSLEKSGKRINSEQMARQIATWLLIGKEIVIVIGGAFGLSAQVKARSKVILSLSDLTFTHEMVRLIFLEQLYRGFTIVRGVPYHY